MATDKDKKEYKDLSVKFSNRLRELIDMVYENKQEPVSYKVVAKEMGITAQSLSHYMSSSRLPRLDLCIKMIDYFTRNIRNFNPDYLLLRKNTKLKQNSMLEQLIPNLSEKAYTNLSNLSLLTSGNEVLSYLFSNFYYIEAITYIKNFLFEIKKYEIPRLLSLQDKYNNKVFDENNNQLHREMQTFYGGHSSSNVVRKITTLQIYHEQALKKTMHSYFVSLFKPLIEDLDKGKDAIFYLYDRTKNDKIEHIIPIKATSSKFIKFMMNNYLNDI